MTDTKKELNSKYDAENLSMIMRREPQKFAGSISILGMPRTAGQLVCVVHGLLTLLK